jgi:hypothetical protein
MRRRHFLMCISPAAAWFGLSSNVHAQFQLFVLTLRRDRNLPTTLTLNDSVTGKLYQGAGSLSDPARSFAIRWNCPIETNWRISVVSSPAPTRRSSAPDQRQTA